MEKFSVLMSVYKKEVPVFFDLSLESNLIKQSVIPNEFILICDGDLTPELEVVISKYQSMFPTILKVYRKENGGLGKALNYGLTKCTYSLVARSDSDDICAPHRFESQLNFFEQNPDVSIISSFIDEFEDEWDKPIRVKKMPLSSEELYEMTKYRNPLNHMAVMMKKDDIISLGSYHHVPYAEDYELWVRALINGYKIANIGDVLVHARVGNGMVQRRGSKKQIKSWHLINKQMNKSGMIGIGTYIRNMIAIMIFVCIPNNFRLILYQRILRKTIDES